MGDGGRTAAQYDAMASEYAADNGDGVYNSLYERPAMLSMLGDVTGLDVLDLGCGAGQLSSELVQRGARVTGVDVSSAMVDIAQGRLGDSASFQIGDLCDPLPFPDATFDRVVASLVMHYIEHWIPVLREVKRVLKPNGVFLFSTHHPTMDWQLHSPDDYFAKVLSTETWTKGTRQFEVFYWRRSLAEISREVSEAGFVIERLDEPMPLTSLSDTDPNTNHRLTTEPHFLFMRLVPRAR